MLGYTVYYMIFARQPSQPAGYPWTVVASGWIPSTSCTPDCDYAQVSADAAGFALSYGESYSRTWNDDARAWNAWEHYNREGQRISSGGAEMPAHPPTPPLPADPWAFLRGILPS